MRCWIAVLAASATLYVAPTVRAEDEKPAAGGDGAALFVRLDADKDGQLTASEAGQEHRRLFDRLMRKADKDANGQLSQDEFVAGLKESGDRPDGAPGEKRRKGGDRPAGAPGQGRPGGRFGQMAERLRQLDKNGDGKVELSEVPEEGKERFEMALDQFDKNDDDAIDREEMAAAARQFGAAAGGSEGGNRPDRPQGPPVVVAAIDTDADGTLSAEEIEGASAALKKLDKDGDGKLTRKELMPAPGAGRTFSREGGPERPFNPEQVTKRLMNHDKNGDGKLQKEELPEGMQRRFDRLDANSDGAIDAEELKAMVAQMQDRAKKGPAAGDAQTKKKADKKAKKKGDQKKKKEAPAST